MFFNENDLHKIIDLTKKIRFLEEMEELGYLQDFFDEGACNFDDWADLLLLRRKLLDDLYRNFIALNAVFHKKFKEIHEKMEGMDAAHQNETQNSYSHKNEEEPF